MSTLSLMEHEHSGVLTKTGYTRIIGYIMGLYKDNGKMETTNCFVSEDSRPELVRGPWVLATHSSILISLAEQ